MQPIITDRDRIPVQLNLKQKYHCSWASHAGMVWVLIGFLPSGRVEIQTPRTKRTITTSGSSLRLINKNAREAALKRIKHEVSS